LTVLSAAEREAVAHQLGREPTTTFEVAARCVEPGGASTHPLVIRNHPVDPDGNPFPTLFWLTCPEAVKAVSRVESTGEIGRLNGRFDHDDEFRASVERAHAEYALERAREHGPAGAWGGVGGTRTGVKCLHAHYANHLAGGDDPIGRLVAHAVEPVHPDEPRGGRVAAFDIGSNTVRLLVANPAADGDDSLLDVCRDTVVTRLGKGVDEHGRIDPESLRASLEVIGRFGRKAAALGATASRVGATSAVRDADNRDELAEGIRDATGVDMEVIAGEQEAGLSFVGATRGLERPRPILVMDIGGGSTEFVVGDDEPGEAFSTQMGSVRMTERVGPSDPPTRDDLDAIAREVDAVLDEVPGWARDARTFVAVAGTATTVQGVALGLDTYDPDRIHRSLLTAEDAEHALEELAGMTTEQRIVLPVMVPGRADVIVAGAVILVRAMRSLRFREAVISETDFLDGLALSLLARGMDEGTAERVDP
jgi:exopolyphosphatase/guanosine-5'-triphosphate,3'-diphosphate pyrophosphatase